MGFSLSILLLATPSPGRLFWWVPSGGQASSQNLALLVVFIQEQLTVKVTKELMGGSGPEREKSGRKSQSVCNKISIHKRRGGSGG